MHIDIITCLPKLLESPFSHSILKRAIDKGVVSLIVHDLRDYTHNKHKNVDDYPFGGGAGMVMMCEPLANCIEHLKTTKEYDAIVYMTPDGETLTQQIANKYSLFNNIMIICGHYKGIDERIRQTYVTHEISIGDYVLSGGELAAAVFCDAIIRIIPGAINDETSALSDSHQDFLLAPPVYTRPAEWNGLKVPDVLLSGHEKNIENWRFEQAIERTKTRRPDLFKKWTNEQ
ncbi:MAG: tRNA (guanosine(37)-N1)-methyltransferase TrmD [Cytophagales bacterium]